MTDDTPTGLPDVDFLLTVAKEFRESGSAKVANGMARSAEALRLTYQKLDAIAEALDLPKESWRIAGCDVLAHQVRDLLRNYMVLRDKYGTEHDLVARQTVAISAQEPTDDHLPPDDVLLKQVDDMRHALELDRLSAASDTAPLILAAQRMLAASDQFVRDTGLKHRDLITDAADGLRCALKKVAPQADQEHGLTSIRSTPVQPAGVAPNAAPQEMADRKEDQSRLPASVPSPAVAAPECVVVPLEVVAYCKHIIAAQCRALAIANESKEYKKASEIRSKLEDAEKAMLAGAPSQNAELVAVLRDVRRCLQIAASYKDDPKITAGLMIHAKDCALQVRKIDDALSSQAQVPAEKTP